MDYGAPCYGAVAVPRPCRYCQMTQMVCRFAHGPQLDRTAGVVTRGTPLVLRCLIVPVSDIPHPTPPCEFLTNFFVMRGRAIAKMFSEFFYTPRTLYDSSGNFQYEGEG